MTVDGWVEVCWVRSVITPGEYWWLAFIERGLLKYS